MLKLTHRFWKYTNFACDLHYNRIHLQDYNLTLRNRYHVLNSRALRNPFIITCPWGRLLASIAKDSKCFKRSDNKKDKMADETGDVPDWVGYQSDEDIIVISSSSSTCSDDLNDCRQQHDYRCWESCSTNFTSGQTFRVLSYNVLAQNLLESHPYLYKDCKAGNLKWEERFSKIFNQIINANPDIICLQEVQEAHSTYFATKLEAIGFKGVFKKKVVKQDGCAIFFRSSKFEMLDYFTVEYQQPHLPILNRDNVACLAKLRLRHQPNSVPIVVVTTHLLYNPRRMDVRLAQIRLLLAEMDRFAYYDTGRSTGHWPIILTGDFNSQPHSQVVRLIREGYLSDPIVDEDHSDWRNIEVTKHCQHLSVFINRVPGNPASDFNATLVHNSDYEANNTSRDNSENIEYPEMFMGMKLTHTLNFASVYDHVKKNGKKEGTTFQNGWVTVDYIFFSNMLKLEERLSLPSISEAKKMGRLPNDSCGSDHIHLAATFSLPDLPLPT